MDLKKYIRDVKNFPIEGIVFKDISPILENPEAFLFAVDEISKKCENIDKIVWLDARGFVFWAAIAYKLNKPFIMVRKTKLYDFYQIHNTMIYWALQWQNNKLKKNWLKKSNSKSEN